MKTKTLFFLIVLISVLLLEVPGKGLAGVVVE